jgi:flagellin
LNGKRAVYGAYENRLEHVINANNNYAENLENAESAIMDADMADELMKQTKYRILEQAGISIKASANSRAENALYLLQ